MGCLCNHIIAIVNKLLIKVSPNIYCRIYCIIIFLLGLSERPITFAQLKPRLMNLVMNALQIETDPQNTHMLLGSLFLCVQDSSIYEKVEQVTQPPTDTSSNLLSSGTSTKHFKLSSLHVFVFILFFFLFVSACLWLM